MTAAHNAGYAHIDHDKVQELLRDQLRESLRKGSGRNLPEDELEDLVQSLSAMAREAGERMRSEREGQS